MTEEGEYGSVGYKCDTELCSALEASLAPLKAKADSSLWKFVIEWEYYRKAPGLRLSVWAFPAAEDRPKDHWVPDDGKLQEMIPCVPVADDVVSIAVKTTEQRIGIVSAAIARLMDAEGSDIRQFVERHPLNLN